MSDHSPSNPFTPPAPLLKSQRDAFDLVPQPLTTFVGRDRELSAVVNLLRRPDVRLVTVTGTGGVGKTRLALRAAEDSQDAFDAAVFVPLVSVRDPPMLLPTVAHYLNVPDAPDTPLLSRLRAFLAHRNLLLVLDNVEHLLDAAPAVAELLAACPRLTILCTCRTALNVSGEHLLPLAPLSGEEARTLFVERVRALVPGFTATDEVADVIDAICARLDGLPLAIELAASRVPTLPPRALLARLEHRLDLLTNGPRDAPPRLRAMRDAIAWSHDLLPQEQQVLFRRLGVFIGGFTLRAVEAMADEGTDVLDALSALVTSSLVVPIEGVADEPRYTMLETIREYALERLEAADELSAVRVLHADYYRALAEDSLPRYDGPDVRLASDQVDIELDNCRAAMTSALETGNAETGIRLAGALWRIWWFAQATGGKPWMDRVSEGLSWIERMLPTRDGLPVEVLTEALTGGATLAHLLGRSDRGQILGAELLAQARTEDYAYGEYWALTVLGPLAEAQGDFDTARQYLAQALSLAPGMRNPENHAALAHLGLGCLELHAENPGVATRHLDEALGISHDTGNLWVIGESAAYLGRALYQQDELDRAATLMFEGLLAFKEQRLLFHIHASLADIALVALAAHQPARAARLLGVAGAFPSHTGRADVTARAVTDTQSHIGEAVFATEAEVGRRLAWNDVLAEIDALIEELTDRRATTLPKPISAHGLSRREIEVLHLVAEGHSSREIAKALSISERTIENHVFRIFTKLGVNSRAAAAAYAVRHGLT